MNKALGNLWLFWAFWPLYAAKMAEACLKEATKERD